VDPLQRLLLHARVWVLQQQKRKLVCVCVCDVCVCDVCDVCVCDVCVCVRERAKQKTKRQILYILHMLKKKP